MNKSFYFPAAAVALLVLGLITLKPASNTTSNTTNNTATSSAETSVPIISNEDKFNITITNGKNAAGAQTYTSTEGRTVRFIVTSNTTGKFDVHGYTKDKKELLAGQVAELSFIVDKTGRFELEFHPEQGDEVVIGALEVNPK